MPDDSPAMTQALLDKAQADARQAVAAAVKAERDNAAADTPGALALRAAQDAQGRAEAVRKGVDSLLPDLSTIKASTLAVDTPVMIWADVLTTQAVLRAAGQVALNAGGALTSGSRVLVTTDSDLATADSVFCDVDRGIDRLSQTVATLLTETESLVPAPDSTLRLLGGATAVATISALVPPLLSLFSADRTLTSAPTTTPDRAATAAVAKALLTRHLVQSVTVERLRTVSRTGVVARADALAGQRVDLATRRTVLAPPTPSAADPAPAESPELTGARAAIDATLAAVDAFTNAIHAVPAGGAASSLTSAALAEVLTDGSIDHVLSIGVHGGAAYQTTENRPLHFDDKFATIATAGLSWVLIETSSGHAVAAGVEYGSAEAHGSVGDRFRIVADQL